MTLTEIHSSCQLSDVFRIPLVGMRRRTRRRMPSPRQVRALDIGVDELHGLLEWELRDRPRALKNARIRYRQFCVELLARLEKAA